MKYKSKLASQFYRDPELTPYGIRRSIDKGRQLQAIVDELFPNGAYSIAASSMIRAQQTAYYMIAKDVEKPIHILPHIGETGIAPTNTPLSAEKQRTLLNSRIVGSFGTDARGDTSYAQRANWDAFLQWIDSRGNDLAPFFTPVIEKGETKYRAVIVTHSNFLKKIFGMKLNNNDILFYTRQKNSETNESEFQRLTEFNDLDTVKRENTVGCLMEKAQNVRSKILTGIGDTIAGWSGIRTRRSQKRKFRARNTRKNRQ